jgi:hypothetical protein
MDEIGGRGWGNYFRSGTSDRDFNWVDEYVYRRLLCWKIRRYGQRSNFRLDDWPRERFQG